MMTSIDPTVNSSVDERPPRACMLGYFNFNTDARVNNYVNFLLKDGYRVDVFCPGSQPDHPAIRSQKGLSIIQVQKQKTQEKNKWVYFANIAGFFIRSMFSLSFYHLKHNYKLIHIHNIPDFLVFTAWLPKMLGARIILDIHDVLPELYARKFNAAMNGPVAGMLRFIEKISCRFADWVIIANDAWRNKLIQRSVSENRCSAIPNFPNRKIFSPIFRSREKGDKAPFIIVYHGSFTEYHGLDVAIRAAGILREKKKVGLFKLYLYGRGPADPEMRELIDSLGLKEHVTIFSGVPYHEIPTILKDADIGVVPKKDGLFSGDALSTKLFEYVAMGIPAVVSRTRAELRYFGEDEVKYFVSGEPEDMARCIQELYENPAMRAEMAKRALRKIDQYNLEANEKMYLHLVNTLTMNHTP